MLFDVLPVFYPEATLTNPSLSLVFSKTSLFDIYGLIKLTNESEEASRYYPCTVYLSSNKSDVIIPSKKDENF